jgi:ferric-dicitrate binding protein FerR (iron transport regulator)
MTERDVDRTYGLDEDVSRLVRLAGPRPAVPEAVGRRVHSAVHAHWRQRLRATRRHRLLMGAAAVLAGVTVLTIFGRSLQPSTRSPHSIAAKVPVVFLEHLTGGELWAAAGGPLAPVTTGAGVLEDTWLETRQLGRAALRIPGGASIRLDTNTRVHVISGAVFWLDRGAIYVDTGADDRAAIEIRTIRGVVRHVGTQFEVQAGPDRTRLRVREGRVVLVRDNGRREASAGTELAVGDEGRVVGRDVPIYGPDWAWVEQSAPEFQIEGQPLEALLRWVARETGWTIRFVSESTARSAAAVTLHGSSTGLTPAETLEAVLPTCNLTVRLKDGTAWIGPLHGRGEQK